MIVYELGGLVKSLAGHDKNNLYIILKEQGEYLFLADGHLKTCEKPKKKNKKHIQTIHAKEETLNEKLLQGLPVADEEIRLFIRQCKRESKEL